jgi:hypothetical protein
MKISAIKIAIITGLLVAAVLYAYITWKKASLLDKNRKEDHRDKAEKYTAHDEDSMTIKDTKYITQKARQALVFNCIDQY